MEEDRKRKVQFLINEMRASGNLPAISENVRDICRITRMKNSCAVDLAAVIMRDAGLSSSIISEANSSYYSPRFPVKTITHAVTFMGFERVYSMALGLSLFKQTMKTPKTRKLANLYSSSYFAGSFAMSLARTVKDSGAEEFFVGGLLYRLPWIALANTFPESFQEMETLIQKKDLTYDKACLSVFDVSYKDICQGLVEMYHLPESLADVILDRENAQADINLIVHEAGSIANMLFGSKLGGKTAINEVNDRLKSLLKNNNFSLTSFIKTTCNSDPNIKNFFNLDKSDVDMMVNALEWGKGNPAMITSSQMVYQEEDPEDTETSGETPEQLIGHFMTELIMICRKKSDVNQTLMLAQEALHKCLGAPEVFTCFFNQKKTILTGRFYVGKRMDITADSFFINIHHSDSPIIRSIKEKRIREWSLSDDVSLHIPSVKKHIKLQKAVFTPILAVGKVIGLYFVGRTTDEPFNEHEKIWLEQIAMYVGMAFESSSRQDANDFMDSGGKND